MKTTTDAENWKFSFTITDLARFLGKSPVTLRHWERQGLIIFPRDVSGDRKVTTDEIRQVARISHKLKRIPDERLNIVEAAVTLLELIEKENQVENSSNGRTPQREERVSIQAS